MHQFWFGSVKKEEITKGGLISESFLLQLKSTRKVAKDCVLAYFGVLSQCENFSEINLPLVGKKL